MKYVVVILLPLSLILGGCGACVFVTSEAACQQAEFNAPRLPRLQVGMTADEVLKIMERPPQRREATNQREVWYFMSDYDAHRMTTITIENGRVVAIGSAPWDEE